MPEQALKAVERVEQDLMRMGHLAEEIMRKAIQSLREQDVELARSVILQDDLVDNLQLVVEEELEQAIAQLTSAGFEMRRHLATLKIAADLERIADYATCIAEVVLELKKASLVEPLVHIPQLATLTMNMMTTVLKAFIEKNADLAEAVCRKDEEADNLYEVISQELVKFIEQETNPQTAFRLSRLILIAEWLERAADLTTDIGEETIYMLTGKRVRY